MHTESTCVLMYIILVHFDMCVCVYVVSMNECGLYLVYLKLFIISIACNFEHLSTACIFEESVKNREEEI